VSRRLRIQGFEGTLADAETAERIERLEAERAQLNEQQKREETKRLIALGYDPKWSIEEKLRRVKLLDPEWVKHLEYFVDWKLRIAWPNPTAAARRERAKSRI